MPLRASRCKGSGRDAHANPSRRLAGGTEKRGIRMAQRYSHKHGVTVHEGPMADARGTGWRADAVRLEAENQERIENPMKTLPNRLTSIDKDRAARAKGDTGTVDATDVVPRGR